MSEQDLMLIVQFSTSRVLQNHQIICCLDLFYILKKIMTEFYFFFIYKNQTIKVILNVFTFNEVQYTQIDCFLFAKLQRKETPTITSFIKLQSIFIFFSQILVIILLFKCFTISSSYFLIYQHYQTSTMPILNLQYSEINLNVNLLCSKFQEHKSLLRS